MKTAFTGVVLLSTLALSLNGAKSFAQAPEDRTDIELAASGRPVAVDALVERQTTSFLQKQPLLATYFGGDIEAMGGAYNHRLPDYSPKGYAALTELMRQAVVDLDALDSSRYDANTQMHVEILKVIRGYYAGSDDFSGGYIDTWGGHLPYAINQISGPLIDAPRTMQNQQPLNSASDAKDYLLRLEALGPMVDGTAAKMTADASAGIILPKNLFPKTQLYIKNFTAFEPAQHPLVVKFANRLEFAEDISNADIEKLRGQAVSLVENVVYPAYARVQVKLTELEKKAPIGDGIWAQPNGAEYYQHALRYLGDTDMTADQVHQVGLDEVARISAEMDVILRSQGLTEGTVGERVSSLEDNPSLLYDDSDAGREELMADLDRWTEEIMQQAPSLFATLPKQKVVVARVPKEAEASAAGGSYDGPSLDGTRPGTFWINLRDMKANPRYALKTLTYHEAVPGHHFQIALNMAQKNLGLDRQNAPFNAYVEGWALYAELVAYEMGMYKDDPYGNLGRLQAEIYRAVRLVVDTGLHHKKWTREEAIDYMIRNTGSAESDVVSAIERYMAWPGQALGYKIGMLKIHALRAKAQKQLGEEFDIREFHDVVLLPGAVPLAILEDNVNQWIAEKKS